jgi:regulator of sirC expression with transglutaminase-like and TPR domain
MTDATRRWLRSDDYQRYVDIAADARSAEDLARLRAELRANWPDDATAQLLAEVLYDQEQSFDASDGARAQTSAVWHDDPTLLQPRRSRRVSTEMNEIPPDAPGPNGAGA